MAWYSGPTLMEHLENVAVGDDIASRPFRLPVQLVQSAESRLSWIRRRRSSAAPSRSATAVRVAAVRRARAGVARIWSATRMSSGASAGQSVTVTLTDELDVSRGDVLAARDAPPAVPTQFEATIVWMTEQPLLQGRSYLLKIGAQTAAATVAPIKYKVNVNTLEHVAARSWR